MEDEERRTGPLWEIQSGRVPAPPAAGLFGWGLLAAGTNRGTTEAAFKARDEFLNPAGTIRGGRQVAVATATVQIREIG